MRTRILLFALLLFSFSVNAQQGWLTQASGTTTWIHDVDFVDSKTGWAVGNDGTILHTSDGMSWTAQQSNTPNDLFAVHFINNLKGWVVGEGGKILITSNGGSTWSNQASGTAKDLQDVFFIDNNFGWIAGNTGTMLVTDNGGILWDPQPTPTLKDILGIHFVNYLRGWATGKEGTILSSVDGGITWVAQTNHPLNGSLTGINAVYFVDEMNGWAGAKAGNILHTANGGLSWSKQTTSTSMGFNDIFFFNVDTGYAVGDNGTIKYTDNGGSTWQTQTPPLSNLLLGIDFPVQDTGWIVGNGGAILYTHNGGLCPVPNILSNPVSQSVCPGDNVIFSVITDDTSASFQWFKNNIALPGDTTSILQIDSVTIANAGAYYCELANACGLAQSNGAVLSLKGLAKVTGQPQSQSVEVGDKVTLSITASGTSISFQWMKDGVDIPNATSYSYVIDSVVQADSGFYSCRVSNICNEAYSDSAFVEVNDYSGIITIDNQASLKFFPNPTNGSLKLEIDNLKNENVSLEITNYSGQVIFKKDYGNKSGRLFDQIDLSKKSKGVYFIRLKSGDAVTADKLIIY